MLQVNGVTKRYGQVIANDRISLTVNPGEIVGLLGENGAGKSTLLSIVGGFQQPDSGSIAIDGRSITIDSPRKALRFGIAVVHQHFALVPTFSVEEQLALAGWTSGHGPEVLGRAVSLRSRIGDLALGQQQQVEIARALVSRPRVLLLDEPTSMLAPREIDDLFAKLRMIRATGTSIVLVTHKIHEAVTLADRVLVLRNGHLTAEEARLARDWREGATDRILDAMFDWNPASVSRQVPRSERRAEASNVLLRVDRLSTMPSPGRQALRNVTFALSAGQRMAILGVNGQGQRELLEAIAGYSAYRGEIRLLGDDEDAADTLAGVGFITDDRIGEGGAADLDLTRNLLLKRQRQPPFARRGILRWRAIQESADRAIREWGIEPADGTRPLATLSGGNVQKLLLAREFSRLPMVLVAANPAHGLDTRTADFLWSELSSFAEQGRGVIFTTTDLGDARFQADTVAVLFNGRLSTPVAVALASDRELGEMMVSGW